MRNKNSPSAFVAATICILILVSTVYISKSRVSSTQIVSLPSGASPAIPFLSPATHPKPTPYTQDINNTFYAYSPFTYSFQHLPEYKIDTVFDGSYYRVEKKTVNIHNSQQALDALHDSEYVGVMIVNFFEDTGSNTTAPIKKEDIYQWLKTSGITAAQCVTDRHVSEITLNDKHIYKVNILCGGANTVDNMFFWEIHTKPGYFVVFEGNENSEQFRLVLKSFMVSY